MSTLITATPATTTTTTSASPVDVAIAYARAQIGKPYATTAIIAFLMQRDWQEPDSWFCSELQAAALVDCGWFAHALATEFNHITPRDLVLIVSGRVAITPAKEQVT